KRFKRYLMKDIQVGSLTGEEINTAEVSSFRMIQHEDRSFLEKFDKTLVVVDEDGLFRFRTPICARDDTCSFRFPVILPGRHPVIKSLIRSTHLKNHHAGLNILTSLLRERCSISSSRKIIRRVIHECVISRRHQTKNVETPPVYL